MYTMAKKQVLGIELTDQCIRLVSIKFRNNFYELECAVEGKLEEGAVVAKNIVNIESVVSSLKKLIEHYKIKNNKAAIAVESRNVISKTLAFDETLTDREIEQQLEYDADKYVPESLDEVRMDFQVIGPSETQGKQDVLVVATHKEPVDICSEVIEAAGMKLDIVDVYHYVLLRVCETIRFVSNYQYNENSCIAIIDLDVWRSQMTIICERTVLLHEDFKFKKKIIDNRSVEEVVPWYKRHMQIFSSNNKNREIDCVVLYGENAEIEGVIELFEIITHKPVYIADPFLDMRILHPQKIDEQSYKYLIPTGLALRKVMT